MKVRTVAMCICFAAALSIGCNATTRHKVLTYLFDGVPPLKESRPAGTIRPGGPENVVPSRQLSFREHGPYAAKLCGACHEAGATNALVAPRERLCFQCHELRLDKRYIHGPLASGGCLVCHDPHSSGYRYLLVSDSDSFCFHCHDRLALAKTGSHNLMPETCTACHDAHMSDRKYLLK